MNALVVGHAEPAAALTSALSERGIDATLNAVRKPSGERAVGDLAESLVELEQQLESERPALAIAVGVGDAPLALAITAAKGGIPLVAWTEGGNQPASGLERAEARILGVLADYDAGEIGDGAAALEAAERIAAWASLESGE